MKILFFTTNLRAGGVEKRTLTLAHYMRTKGHQVKIVTIDCTCDYKNLVTDYQLEFQPLLNREVFSLYRDFFRIRTGLKKVLRVFQPDIIQVFNFHALVIAQTFARQFRVCYCLASTYSVRWDKSDRKSLLTNLTEKLIYKNRSINFIAISKGVSTVFKDRFGLPSTVIYNGVDEKSIAFVPKKSLGERVINIFCLGTIEEERKNFSMAIRALSVLKKTAQDKCDYHLHVVGDGPDKNFLQSLTAELSLTESVQFWGFQPDVSSFFQKAHVFWITSKHEGFGLVGVEAMLSGTPVIANKIPGIDEIIVHRETGLFPKHNFDPHSLAEETTNLLNDQHLYRSLIRRGRSHAQKYFTAEQMGENYLTYYRKVLS